MPSRRPQVRLALTETRGGVCVCVCVCRNVGSGHSCGTVLFESRGTFLTSLSGFGYWLLGVATCLARRLLPAKDNPPHEGTAGVATRPRSPHSQQLEDGSTSLVEPPGRGGGEVMPTASALMFLTLDVWWRMG